LKDSIKAVLQKEQQNGPEIAASNDAGNDQHEERLASNVDALLKCGKSLTVCTV